VLRVDRSSTSLRLGRPSSSWSSSSSSVETRPLHDTPVLLVQTWLRGGPCRRGGGGPDVAWWWSVQAWLGGGGPCRRGGGGPDVAWWWSVQAWLGAGLCRRGLVVVRAGVASWWSRRGLVVVRAGVAWWWWSVQAWLHGGQDVAW